MPPTDAAPRTARIPQHPAVYRFLSAHSFDPPPREDAPLVLLHIPKTGGTWLTDLIIHNLQTRESPAVFYAPHAMTAQRAVELFGPRTRLAVVLRDPLERLVSAFQSRKRQGRPAYDTPWTDAEARVFARYPDIGAVARALASPLPRHRRRARQALGSMTLVPRGYAHAFGPAAQAGALIDRVALCPPIDALSSQLDGIMAGLGFADYDHPPRPMQNRATPPPPLGPAERLILRHHLREDYRVYEMLRARAARLGDE